jgi:hypothetical protein
VKISFNMKVKEVNCEENSLDPHLRKGVQAGAK